ncbi:MGH1-like glycoside hydrolase domain-containing protein [Streptomyces boninensis]|uniref:MGH1-like glycoside hydrolase domain-containing protein n=1 Tax=Streptomyces boninensis TaxID=2039455 RepID=UPI003B219A1B
MPSPAHHRPVSRRTLLFGSAVAGLAAAGTMPSSAAAADDARPAIEFGGAHDALLGGAYRSALQNLLEINTVPYDPAEYNQTGLLTDPPGTFIRAGGGYEQPWTRDASVNSWNAASLLSPTVARNTLWSVCRRQDDGTLIVQQDNQWWDQVIWVIAAREHFLLTGDRTFLTDAYEAAANTLDRNRDKHFNAAYGLFEGPAFMQDGIAGYPSPPYDPANDSSFVLDHPHTDKMLSLSTNCLYYAAHLAAADLAAKAGERRAAGRWRAAAAQLRTAVNRHLWRPEAGSYGSFIHGTGPKAGRLEPHQETNGLAFAVLCGVASRRQVRTLLDGTHQEPHGVVNVWPHFDRFDDARPGRHNVIVWPMTTAMWGHAAARGGRTDLFARTVTDIAELWHGDGHFWEIYNARTGAVDGGWQVGRQWDSQPDQTWSATGYLRLIHQGLFGLRAGHRGLSFAPSLPPDWGPVTLSGLAYRGATLDLTVEGEGSRVASCTLDGRPAPARIPAGLTGQHELRIEVA